MGFRTSTFQFNKVLPTYKVLLIYNVLITIKVLLIYNVLITIKVLLIYNVLITYKVLPMYKIHAVRDHHSPINDKLHIYLYIFICLLVMYYMICQGIVLSRMNFEKNSNLISDYQLGTVIILGNC